MKKTIFAGIAVILLCVLIISVQFIPTDDKAENIDLNGNGTEKKDIGENIADEQEKGISANRYVTSEGDCYTVFEYDNFTYDCYIKDKNGKEIFSVKGSPDYPAISKINDDILSCWVQTGTGNATRIKRYFNVKTGEVSRAFSYVLGEAGEDVIYVNFDNDRGYSVMACNMFDETDINCIAILEDVHTVEPIAEYTISEDLIYIVYLKGKDYVETEIRIVPENALDVSYPYGETKGIVEKLIAEIEGAYERECGSPQAFTTAGMKGIDYKYKEKWKEVAYEYYEKTKALGDGRYAEAIEKIKENGEKYIETELENYGVILKEIFDRGTIQETFYHGHEYELYKAWALSIVDIYLTATIPYM